MASTETPHASNGSLFGTLWHSWLRKRRRDRVRALSQIRFRLTREGVHYVGILLFIFTGAILRDINLLILLAGAMIGLLLLQWRFNTRTLVGLSASRRLPRNTSVGKATDIPVTVSNPKRWLGSWLILVEDPLRKMLPASRKLTEKGLAVVSEIRPNSSSASQYQLTFHQRGQFQVGPSTISTRFPLGLGRGSRTLDNTELITVLPRLGTLSSRVESLFQQEMNGNARAAPQAGLHEADFYGLRPWTTGDSRRWIHWRTTARLGELSVRQFERQQRRQVCVLLDLYRPAERKKEKEEFDDNEIERAISFLATLAHWTVKRGGDRLAVAVAANDHFALPSVQSAVLVENLLERLAVVSTSDAPNLVQALHGLAIPLMNNPHLVVISTREDQSDLLRKSLKGTNGKLFSRLNVTWLNAARGDLERFFSWT